MLNGVISPLEIFLLILDEAYQLVSAIKYSTEECCSFFMAMGNSLLQLHPPVF